MKTPWEKTGQECAEKLEEKKGAGGRNLRIHVPFCLLLLAGLALPGINYGMEEEIKKPVLSTINADRGPISFFDYFDKNTNSQIPHYLKRDIMGKYLNSYSLVEMEIFLLGTLPLKVIKEQGIILKTKKEEEKENKEKRQGKLVKKIVDTKYKLWAQDLSEKLKEEHPLFYKAGQVFENWAWMKREYVEKELGMPKAGSPEEEPYLFKKGWFDASSDPQKSLPYFNDHDFFLSDLVTQEIWVEVMGENPSYYPNKKSCPEDIKIVRKLRPGKEGKGEWKEIKYCQGWAVTDVTLYDVQKFVYIMNMGSPAGVKFDIPTEGQYGLAERGGIVSDNRGESINTGSFGSLEVRNLDEFKTKIPWTGNKDGGPGRTKQKDPFPRPIGPYDLRGHLNTWTKSLARGIKDPAGFAPYTTKQSKNWGLDWELEKAADATNYVLGGADYYFNRIFLDLSFFTSTNPSIRAPFLGFRLLRTTHSDLNDEREK